MDELERVKRRPLLRRNGLQRGVPPWRGLVRYRLTRLERGELRPSSGVGPVAPASTVWLATWAPR